MTTENTNIEEVKKKHVMTQDEINFYESCKERDAFEMLMKTYMNKLKIEDLFMSHLTIPEVIAEMRSKLFLMCINRTYSKFTTKDFPLLHSDIDDEVPQENIREFYFDDYFFDLMFNQ